MTDTPKMMWNQIAAEIDRKISNQHEQLNCIREEILKLLTDLVAVQHTLDAHHD